MSTPSKITEIADMDSDNEQQIDQTMNMFSEGENQTNPAEQGSHLERYGLVANEPASISPPPPSSPSLPRQQWQLRRPTSVPISVPTSMPTHRAQTTNQFVENTTPWARQSTQSARPSAAHPSWTSGTHQPSSFSSSWQIGEQNFTSLPRATFLQQQAGGLYTSPMSFDTLRFGGTGQPGSALPTDMQIALSQLPPQPQEVVRVSDTLHPQRYQQTTYGEPSANIMASGRHNVHGDTPGFYSGLNMPALELGTRRQNSRHVRMTGPSESSSGRRSPSLLSTRPRTREPARAAARPRLSLQDRSERPGAGHNLTQPTTPPASMPPPTRRASPNVASERRARLRAWPSRPSTFSTEPSRPQTFPTVTLGAERFRGTRSAQRLLGYYGNDTELRTRANIRVARARSARAFAGITAYPSADTAIPGGITLADLCQRYPRHAWGAGLRLFIAAGWTAREIWEQLPVNMRRNSDRTGRHWNYLQQAFGREVDTMHTEEGLTRRQPQPRQLVRRRRQETGDRAEEDTDKSSHDDGGADNVDNSHDDNTDN